VRNGGKIDAEQNHCKNVQNIAKSFEKLQKFNAKFQHNENI